MPLPPTPEDEVAATVSPEEAVPNNTGRYVPTPLVEQRPKLSRQARVFEEPMNIPFADGPLPLQSMHLPKYTFPNECVYCPRFCTKTTRISFEVPVEKQFDQTSKLKTRFNKVSLPARTVGKYDLSSMYDKYFLKSSSRTDLNLSLNKNAMYSRNKGQVLTPEDEILFDVTPSDYDDGCDRNLSQASVKDIPSNDEEFPLPYVEDVLDVTPSDYGDCCGHNLSQEGLNDSPYDHEGFILPHIEDVFDLTPSDYCECFCDDSSFSSTLKHIHVDREGDFPPQAVEVFDLTPSDYGECYDNLPQSDTRSRVVPSSCDRVRPPQAEEEFDLTPSDYDDSCDKSPKAGLISRDISSSSERVLTTQVEDVIDSTQSDYGEGSRHYSTNTNSSLSSEDHPSDNKVLLPLKADEVIDSTLSDYSECNDQTFPQSKRDSDSLCGSDPSLTPTEDLQFYTDCQALANNSTPTDEDVFHSQLEDLSMSTISIAEDLPADTEGFGQSTFCCNIFTSGPKDGTKSVLDKKDGDLVELNPVVVSPPSNVQNHFTNCFPI